jgi:hypothetical protein
LSAGAATRHTIDDLATEVDMNAAEVTAMPHAIDRRRLVLGLSGPAAAAFPQDATAKAQHARQGAALNYPVTYHRTKTVDGIKIFYREAGPGDAPVVVCTENLSPTIMVMKSCAVERHNS